MVATPALLLLYVIAPELLLVGNVVTLKGALPYVFDAATENVLAESVGVGRGDTVSVLLVLIALVNCPATAACVALKLTSPALTMVIQFPDASIVATLGLLLLYAIAPVLLLVGRVKLLNDASPYSFDAATENVLVESVGVARATISVLLVLVAPAYWAVAAWVALKLTSPALTMVILQIGDELPVIRKLDMDATVATLISEVYVASPEPMKVAL